MNRILRFLVMGLLSLLFWSSAYAAEETPTLTTPSAATTNYTQFTFESGDTLWSHAMREGVKVRDWPEFWQSTCTRSNLPCTEDAWRAIQPGTTVLVPLTPNAILHMEAAHELSVLNQELASTKQALEDTAQSLALARAEIADLKAQSSRISLGALVLLCVVLAWGVWYFTRPRTIQPAVSHRDASVPRAIPDVTSFPDTIADDSDAHAKEEASSPPSLQGTGWYEVTPDDPAPALPPGPQGFKLSDLPERPPVFGQDEQPSSRTATRH